MTTISAGRVSRIDPPGAPAQRVGRQLSVLLTGALLVLIALLVVGNHVMALPGGSFAEIGVSDAVLRDAGGHTAPRHRAAIQDANGSAAGRSAHDLHHCFVRARRAGQDPGICRMAP